MCWAYVNLIDLTAELPSDQEEEEPSDIDDLPLPKVSLSSTYGRYIVYIKSYVCVYMVEVLVPYMYVHLYVLSNDFHLILCILV